MTLQTLFEIPMSLTDIHFIHPWSMESWCQEVGLEAELLTTVDYDKANHVNLVKDLSKRIPNALRDVNMHIDNVSDFLRYITEISVWLEEADDIQLHGATAIYRISHQVGATDE